MNYRLLILNIIILSALKFRPGSLIDLHARNTSEQIIHLIKSLRMPESLSSLIDLACSRRLNFFPEYVLAVQKSSTLLDEIAHALVRSPKLQKNHIIRNRLLNHKVLLYGDQSWLGEGDGNLLEDSSGLFDGSTCIALFKSSTPGGYLKETAAEQAIFICGHSISLLKGDDTSLSDFYRIIEGLFKTKLILTNCLEQDFDRKVPVIKKLRDLFYRIRLQSIRYPSDKVFLINELLYEIYETDLDLLTVKDEPKLYLEQFENELLNDELLALPGTISEMKQAQVYRAARCNLLVLYFASAPHQLADSFLENALSACMNGLVSEDAFVALCENMKKRKYSMTALVMADLIFQNSVDVAQTFKKLSKHFKFLKWDHSPYSSFAFSQVVCQSKGYLTPKHALMPLNQVRLEIVGAFRETLKEAVDTDTWLNRLYEPEYRVSLLAEKLQYYMRTALILKCDLGEVIRDVKESCLTLNLSDEQRSLWLQVLFGWLNPEEDGFTPADAISILRLN